MPSIVDVILVSLVLCLILTLFTGGDDHREPRSHRQQQRPPVDVRRPEYKQDPPAQQRPQPPRRPSGPPRRSLEGQTERQNQLNQADPHYTSLRDRARQEGDAMARAFQDSRAAYDSGERGRAKELSNEGQAHKAEMGRLNREASEWIFRENNKTCLPGEIDLHGLFVKEAIEFSDKGIEDAQRRGESELRLIVGKGNHSFDGQAKIKPAIEELMRKYKLTAALDPDNAGVLIVQLKRGGAVDRARKRGAPVLGAGDISRKLDSRDDGCIIV
ncbi:unnamed protein product [Peniophora sp. CBMAI 1063]|nr:unnamed protein product [Peniophora sp. CBMAI 1063]